MTGALTTGSAIRLLAPPEDLGPLALADYDEAGDTDDDRTLRLDELQRGGFCDPADYRRQWFAMAKGTVLESDEARAEFLARYCAATGRLLTSSLSEFLKHATDLEAIDLLSEAEKCILDSTPDPDTGELPMEPEEQAAAESLTAQLFDTPTPEPEQPPPADPDVDPVADIQRFKDYVTKRGASGKITVQWDRAHEIGDLLSSVLQSGGAGIDIARFLISNATATYQSLTAAEADGLLKLADLPRARVRLLAIHALAEAWLVSQKRAAQPAEPSVLA